MKVKVKSLSHVQLFGTPWIVAYQAPQSMEFSRQDYWSGLPFPSPADLPNPGIEPRSPTVIYSQIIVLTILFYFFLLISNLWGKIFCLFKNLIYLDF